MWCWAGMWCPRKRELIIVKLLKSREILCCASYKQKSKISFEACCLWFKWMVGRRQGFDFVWVNIYHDNDCDYEDDDDDEDDDDKRSLVTFNSGSKSNTLCWNSNVYKIICRRLSPQFSPESYIGARPPRPRMGRQMAAIRPVPAPVPVLQPVPKCLP